MLVAILALVLGACGPGAEPEQAAPETTAAPEDGETETTEAPEPAAGEDPIVVALSDQVNILEPHTFRSESAYAATRSLYGPLLDQVFEERDGVLVGTAQFEGELVESFEVTDDGTATFVIHPEARFASGDPVTAEDVAWTLTRTIEGPGYIGLLLPFIGIESRDQIEVVDERTVRITPSVRSPLFERFMTFQVYGPLNKSLGEEQASDDDPWAFEYFTFDTDSSGPYQLVEFDSDTGQVVLEPNPGYPQPVHNSGVIIQTVPEPDERALLLQRGEIDYARGLPPRLLRELEDDPNVRVFSAPSTRINYVGMNTQIAPLDNRLVRQAISWAVPYEAILEQVMFGFARTGGTLVTSPMETYAGDELGVYHQDLERAQQLLDESGVGPFSIELAVTQARPVDRQAAVFIQDALREIGIDVQINQLPDAEYQERRNAKELAMFFHDWYSWGDDPFYQMTFLHKCEQFTNFVQYCNDELDQIIEEGTFETDPARRQELSTRAQEIMLEDAPAVYLMAVDWAVAVRNEIGGVAKDFTEVPRLEMLRREG